ncbi:hypothetical protein Tco_1185593 [Tanacetum coccineum]
MTHQLFTPLDNPERVFCSKRSFFKTLGLVESSSPEFDLFSDIEERSEEEATEIMVETMEQYMSKTRWNYGSGVARPKINDKTHFELKGQFLKKLHKNTFSGSEHVDANEHIEKVLEIVDLFHIPKVTQDQIMLRAFPMSLTGDASRWLEELNQMAQWTSTKTRSTKTSDGLAAIQAQLTSLGREIKKVNEKVYTAQVGCEVCKGPHYTKDCPLKEEGKTFKEAYYIQFGAPYQPGGQYRAIGQMSKVLQERGFGSLPSSTKTNPRDQVKSISTNKANSTGIHRIRSGPYAEAREVKILETYDHTLPQKEKDPGSFTLPCFIHNVCFDKALVDLGASVSVMPFSTYTNLGLGDLAHTRLTIKLADRTIKHPRGIAKNVLVRIGKFIFPIDFIILDIPEDNDVPLILEQPFLSTAHAKIDVFKRKFTLRVGEEKLVFKALNPLLA